jgi:hypothetical protein
MVVSPGPVGLLKSVLFLLNGDRGRLDLSPQRDPEIGPYQPAPEDGMMRFHAYLRRKTSGI